MDTINIYIFVLFKFIWDKLNNGFNHKLPKVREEMLNLFENSLDRYIFNLFNNICFGK